MKKFTRDEKMIAKNINKKYKWIARDSYGNIYVHQKKPTKLETCWNTFNRSGEFFVFNHMFKSIKWEDDEPTRICDIYKPQILDDVEREYLKTILKPFHDEVGYIKKSEEYLAGEGWCKKEFLFIKLRDGGFTFPSFDPGKMYSGMELDKQYKLYELGITYTEGKK